MVSRWEWQEDFLLVVSQWEWQENFLLVVSQWEWKKIFFLWTKCVYINNRSIKDIDILGKQRAEGDERTDRSTAEIVEYIAHKEQAKSEHGTVAGDNTPATAAVTPKWAARPWEVVMALTMVDGPRDLGSV